MNTLKQGDILKHKNSDNTRKILGICGDICFLSSVADKNDFGHCLTLEETEKHFILPEEKFEPKEDELYYYVDQCGEIDKDTWSNNSNYGNKLKNYTGIFRTEEEAEARLLEIKSLLGK